MMVPKEAPVSIVDVTSALHEDPVNPTDMLANVFDAETA